MSCPDCGHDLSIHDWDAGDPSFGSPGYFMCLYDMGGESECMCSGRKLATELALDGDVPSEMKRER